MSLPGKKYDVIGPISCASNITEVLSPSSGERIFLGKSTLSNRSGSSVDVGIGYKQTTAMWEAGVIDASDTPDFTDDTASFQSSVANSATLFTGTANDGFLIQSTERFWMASFAVGDGQANGVYAYQYYNGTSMTALTPIVAADFANVDSTYFLFMPPSNWVKGTTTAVTGDADKYCLQVISTTEPDAAITASAFKVYTLIDFYPQLATNSEVAEDWGQNEAVCPANATVFTFFGGTASASNNVKLTYRNK